MDPEGIAVSPQGTVFISSEGVASKGIAPFVKEFDLKTGKGKQSLRIPQRFLPNVPGKDSGEPRGVRDNLGFEGLTLADVGLAKQILFAYLLLQNPHWHRIAVRRRKNQQYNPQFAYCTIRLILWGNLF